MYRKTDFYKVKLIFIFLAKLFETCIMGANDDLDGKTTHFYSFLDTNDIGTKMSKTSHSARTTRILDGRNSQKCLHQTWADL